MGGISITTKSITHYAKNITNLKLNSSTRSEVGGITERLSKFKNKVITALCVFHTAITNGEDFRDVTKQFQYIKDCDLIAQGNSYDDKEVTLKEITGHSNDLLKIQCGHLVKIYNRQTRPNTKLIL